MERAGAQIKSKWKPLEMIRPLEPAEDSDQESVGTLPVAPLSPRDKKGFVKSGSSKKQCPRTDEFLDLERGYPGSSQTFTPLPVLGRYLLCSSA